MSGASCTKLPWPVTKAWNLLATIWHTYLIVCEATLLVFFDLATFINDFLRKKSLPTVPAAEVYLFGLFGLFVCRCFCVLFVCTVPCLVPPAFPVLAFPCPAAHGARNAPLWRILEHGRNDTGAKIDKGVRTLTVNSLIFGKWLERERDEKREFNKVQRIRFEQCRIRG